MTALTKYDRLEATGLWRATPQDQRREVVVSIGNATLVIKDLTDKAITHWSLAAVERSTTGNAPATFHPDGDPGETLDLAADEADMIDAIDQLRRAVAKARPRPGRLRWLGAALSVSAVVAGVTLWLPGALTQHALDVVPTVIRAQIGEDLLRRIQRVTGQPCRSVGAVPGLKTLALRTNTENLVILRSGLSDSLSLPGGKILLHRGLVEGFEEPDVAAGYILAETLRIQTHDPLETLLSQAGMRASISLLTTGNLPSTTLDAHAERILQAPRPPVDDVALLAAFASAEIRSSPYAYARDITGEETLPLIEADPMRNADPKPLLRDADWLRLQAICGS
ncbi:hypothetical protein [Ascidiaceihabitans sp.]|uniref:hypothetical protein n=1 Tax=Ascidiaceihabitans sp. TaxID=1872644 RepID=UPI003298EDE1